MSITHYLNKPKGLWYYTSIFWKQFLKNLHYNRVSNKVDNKDWVGIKLKSSVIPQGWSSENSFAYLEKEYNGMIFKRFND